MSSDQYYLSFPETLCFISRTIIQFLNNMIFAKDAVNPENLHVDLLNPYNTNITSEEKMQQNNLKIDTKKKWTNITA